MALWDQAVTGSYMRSVRVELWNRQRQRVSSNLAWNGGTVAEEKRNGIRSSLSINLPGSVVPLLGYGSELHVYSGINFGSGAPEMVEMGWFPISDFEVAVGDPSANLSLTLSDRWQQVVDREFGLPVASTPGIRVYEQIERLIKGAGFPTVTMTSTSTAKMTEQVWTSRNQAILDLADAIGAEVGVSRAGVPFVRNRPLPTGSPVVTYADGEGGARISWRINQSLQGVRNIGYFTCSWPDPASQFPTQRAAISDPASPALPALIGARPFTMTDPNVSTAAQAQSALRKQLTKLSTRARQHALTTIPDAKRQPGDIIGLLHDDGTVEKAQIQSVTHPLGPDEAQQISTVNTRDDEGSGL